MDVIIKPANRGHFIKNKFFIGGVALVLAIIWLYSKPAGHEKVARHELILGEVKSGDMDVQVTGYGVLRSDQQKLITSLTPATVEQIVLKPGAAVTSDSVILRLSNPDLIREVERAQQNLAQQQANLRRLKLTNSREIMTENALLAQLIADYETVKFRREGEEELIDGGSVSRLNYNSSKLEEKQLQERIKIHKTQKEQLLLVHQEAVNIQQEQINQATSLLNMAQVRVARLTVTAGISGVLQDLPVELGQSVATGQALALVGSTDDLIALIKVPQSHAEKVQVGQKAIVDTRRDKVSGEVTRIDPAVENGTVTVEVAFTESLPASARPELSVNGSILTERLKNILFVERPVGASENARLDLFKYDHIASMASVSSVAFGIENGPYIQIKSGANVGERIVLSDMSQFQKLNQITVIQ
ncbi:MAG: HlyD family efflux transporter periplasmic adaptor subunit [Pseudomonadota bacterium]